MIDLESEIVLKTLSAALELEGALPMELVVCGGVALQVLGLVERTTHDLDLLAMVDGDRMSGLDSVRDALETAAQIVSEQLGLAERWLDPHPAEMNRQGLPEGLLERTTPKPYGELTIRFISRYDQIHLKLYALVDQGGGKHLDDFLALKPKDDEVRAAFHWVLTQEADPEPMRLLTLDALRKIGFEDVAQELSE